MLPVEYRANHLKLGHNIKFNIVNGDAPQYLMNGIKIPGDTDYNTRSGNLACFISSVIF